MKKTTRTETDALGKKSVPLDAPRGIYTERVLENYPQGAGLPLPEFFLRTYIRAKLVYASVNYAHHKISRKVSSAIHKAGKYLLSLKSEEFMTYFPISRIQSGGGTSTNMNVNEVLANLAGKELGERFGSYIVNPHDDVNASQSSNDTFPGTVKVTVILLLQTFINELNELRQSLHDKAKQTQSIQKVGRTHLQDAVVVMLGDEFSAYARTVKKHCRYFTDTMKVLLEVNYGGTAIGSLQNISKKLRKELIHAFSKEFGVSFKQPDNYFEQNSSSSDLYYVSSSIEHFCSDLLKICNDIRLLGSGPFGSIHEINLPEVQPGSSIMPGKVNPSIPEAMSMICADCIGKHTTVGILSRMAQLELQQFMPTLARSLIDSIENLTAGIRMLRSKCIGGIQPHMPGIQKNLERSFVYATDYSETLGYDYVAQAVKQAISEGKSLKEILASTSKE